MTEPRHALGLAAEELVATWLTGEGWRVIARRRRSPDGGEVDLVALDRAGVLVALEVRARMTARSGRAATSVDRRHVRRLARTLAAVAGSCGEPHAGLRIDIVTVEPAAGRTGRWRVARIPNVG